MNLPTPVVIAGAVLCLLGGYLLGVLLGPESPDRTVGTVTSYDPTSQELCLEGESVRELAGAEEDVLCGTWQRAPGSQQPGKGDRFRFVSGIEKGPDKQDLVVIFGEVDG